MILAVVICLGMLRLGIWQLDRADQKQTILTQSMTRSLQAPVALTSISSPLNTANIENEHRFLQVYVEGRYLPDQTLFLDNQVVDSKVGYAVITPFVFAESGLAILVNRGWIGKAESGNQLPIIETPLEKITLTGRLNNPTEQPPLWNESYPVYQDDVWQFLPIDKIRQETQLDLMPLVLELAPDDDSASDELVRRWQTLDDEWVNKHKAYALQWFSMAIVFFIACLVLVLRSNKNPNQ